MLRYTFRFGGVCEVGQDIMHWNVSIRLNEGKFTEARRSDSRVCSEAGDGVLYEGLWCKSKLPRSDYGSKFLAPTLGEK